MGFLKDFVAPTTHTVRHGAAHKPDSTCVVPGCSKKAKSGRAYHGTCGRPTCQAFVAGGW